MSFLDRLLGKPIASSEKRKETLNSVTGVPALGLDALSSIAYGPEASLVILSAAGIAGIHHLPVIMFAILALLAMLYFSYLQTIAAYPNGGGAYTVAKENLGTSAGLIAAAALLLDYLLNVAVGISAGVAAIISAIPALHKYNLLLCLLVLLILMITNLRGIRETGFLFGFPLILFVVCIGVTSGLGLFHFFREGGNPHPVGSIPLIPKPVEAISVWLIVRAFASGCTAMTGVEAVSNAVPIFKDPKVRNARMALTLIVGLLAVFLLFVAYLCPAYHIGGMDQQQPGYQSILSQLVAAVAGRGWFYYVAISSILTVLAFSANTSFADFPRVCRLLAEDGFLPHAFANLGRKLVYSIGIIVLTIFSGLLLILFGGITDKLIPLFAVGAFTAFTLSQSGMILHWRRRSGRKVGIGLTINSLGAAFTGAALIVIIIAKFMEGAWLSVLIIPAFVWIFRSIHTHYELIDKEVEHPVELAIEQTHPALVVIPIEEWNRISEKALRLAFKISADIIAVHISTDGKNDANLEQIWKEKVAGPALAAGIEPPRLKIIHSPYRLIYEPILDYVRRVRRENPDRIVAIVLPELVEPHWYEYILHNLHASGLRTLLFREEDDRTMIISSPWNLHDR